MALAANTLRDEILAITAAPPFPATAALARVEWSAAFAGYFSQAVAPVWSAAAIAAGRVAFEDTWSPMTAAKLRDAIVAMAVAMCAVMVVPVPPVLPYWTALPPVALLVLPDLPPTFDPVTPATVVAQAVHAWAIQGTAQLVTEPPVPGVKWS
jgi:hypothetical protein